MVTNLDVAANIASSLVVLQNNALQQLTISNPNQVALQSVKLYDLNGKLLLDKQKLGAPDSCQFSTQGLCKAVYLVEIVTHDNQKIAHKIIVSHP